MRVPAIAIARGRVWSLFQIAYGQNLHNRALSFGAGRRAKLFGTASALTIFPSFCLGHKVRCHKVEVEINLTAAMTSSMHAQFARTAEVMKTRDDRRNVITLHYKVICDSVSHETPDQNALGI